MKRKNYIIPEKVVDWTSWYEAQKSPEMSALRSEQQRKQVECPHCGKIGAFRIMQRWHFDNCKNKKEL